MPGEISEHEGFLRAKMDLEERRMRQINEVMTLEDPRIPHDTELPKYWEISQEQVGTTVKGSLSPHQPLTLNTTPK